VARKTTPGAPLDGEKGRIWFFTARDNALGTLDEFNRLIAASPPPTSGAVAPASTRAQLRSSLNCR
jgi:hypothetical protein